jgi:hypothetical protein
VSRRRAVLVAGAGRAIGLVFAAGFDVAVTNAGTTRYVPPPDSGPREQAERMAGRIGVGP